MALTITKDVWSYILRLIWVPWKKNRVKASRGARHASYSLNFFGNVTKAVTLNTDIMTFIVDKATLFETIDQNKRLSSLILSLLTFVTVHPLLEVNAFSFRRKIIAQRVNCRHDYVKNLEISCAKLRLDLIYCVWFFVRLIFLFRIFITE